MTIDQIFKRYEVPHDVQEQAYSRAAFMLAIRDAWIGPTVDWSRLVRAAVFVELGDNAAAAHVRKKIGLDKYIVTLFARAASERLEAVLLSNDWHQIILLFVRLKVKGVVDERLETLVAAQLLHDVVVVSSVGVQTRAYVAALEVFHYKNPSV
jgi:hypothetical protein